MESSIRLGNFVKGIAIILCVAATSMFYFPFEFRVLPGLNTKKLLAATALVIILWKLVQKRELKMDTSFLYLSILAGLVSVCGIISVTYNNTEDYTYATYITSCWVWWGAAYTVCQSIKWVHGEITWTLFLNYLVTICVFQCIIALIMDQDIVVKDAINSVVWQNDEDMVFEGNVHRLYGIGAALDVAGSRFAAVLVMMVYLLANSSLQKKWYKYLLYFVAFIFIGVAGNMIARTTLVGMVVGVLYLAIITFKQVKFLDNNYLTMWSWLIGLLVVCIPLVVYEYNNNEKIHDQLRFGFEGFFNLAERGNFTYSSNEKLKTMYIWPDNAKTWIIGDGYFNNPVVIDPYYTGEITGGYYKNTDVGYLRFIFYFGVIGLLLFTLFFIEVGRTCIRRFPEWKVMFLLLLLLHFAVWAKVSTDMFLAFAPFLCFDTKNEDCLSDSGNV